MKKKIIIISLTVILASSLAFFMYNYVLIPTAEMQSARLIFHGGPNSRTCRIDVYSDGTMEVAVNEGGSFWLLGFDGDPRNKINNPKGKTKKLSRMQRNEIDALITKLKENGDVGVSVDSFPSDTILIHGVVGESHYNASFENLSGWVRTEVNFDLVRLAYKLVDISPKVEGTRIWDSPRTLKRWDLSKTITKKDETQG